MNHHAANLFREVFHSMPDNIIQSPGRINIIGEHTDYNEGFVLPAAIDKFIFIAIQKRSDNAVCLYSNEFDEHYESTLDNLFPKKGHWSNYILGVVDQMIKREYSISGFNALVSGNIPIGSGLSSSAAVECATVFALNELFELRISKIEMVKIAQRAEHEFAHVKCGVMDMFASLLGKKDHAIRLDCRSFNYEYIPLSLIGYKFVLFNSNVKHNLSASEYNERRHQCELGVGWIREYEEGVTSLRDVTLPMLNNYLLNKNDVVYHRCKYVIEENLRLVGACRDLKRGDLTALGKKMFATHNCLSKDYEVSCPELDVLVKLVSNRREVLGARLMGGGFGGCTINLVKENAIDNLIKKVSEAYSKKTGLECSSYIVSISDGTSVTESVSNTRGHVVRTN